MSVVHAGLRERVPYRSRDNSKVYFCALEGIKGTGDERSSGRRLLLCGAVRYRAMTQPMMVGNCYCVDCRKSSGTTHCTHAMVPDAAFSATGRIKVYERPADSGNIVSRGFCPAWR